MVTVAIAAVLPVVNDPAHAMQTEIRQRKVQQMREGLALWNRKVERMERLEAKRAAAEAAREAAEAERTLSARTDTATPTAAPSYSFGVLSAEQVASYARAAGFPEYHVDDMVAIASRESGFCPSAVYGYGCNIGGTVHGSNACGLWQIYKCPGPEALNPATNAALAYAKYQAAGLSPWE